MDTNTTQSTPTQNDHPSKFIPSDETIKKTSGIVKGAGIFNYLNKYALKFPKSPNANCRVSVIDTNLKTWAVRLDKAHKGANFNHININHKVSGVRDPHLKLPPGGLTAGVGVARFCKAANDINTFLIPVVVALEVYEMTKSVQGDYSNGTTRKSAETFTRSAGGWLGGFTGAGTGAAIGSCIMPGVGTVVGALAGSISGGVLGSWAGLSSFRKISDAYDYDIQKSPCEVCLMPLKNRTYLGEKKSDTCKDCSLDQKGDQHVQSVFGINI